MNRTDTIAAISTPAGVGGIAVVRLSGPDALAIAMRHLSAATLAPRHATYCRFDELDDVVATYFPTGYTGEQTVEISCHGSLYIQQTIIGTLVGDGARLAEPGEFTMRAFLGGRLDLSQAEAVADLIDAATPQQHRLAVSQLRGGYASALKELRRQLLDLTSLLELELDFSQEDVEFADRDELRRLLTLTDSQVTKLTDSFAIGNALKQGIAVAITGSPNVGKSSLLNAIVADERAIVSPIPGTTRDTVEETICIDGITFRLVDTAGLRETHDTIERLGIERSRRAINEAQIVIEVEDVTLGHDFTAHSAHHGNKKYIRVLNKCDIDSSAWQFDGKHIGDTLYICTSAVQGTGIDSLKHALRDAVDVQTSTDTMLTNVRHLDALHRVHEALQAASEGFANDIPADLVAVDLRDALYHLGTITGEATSDEILGNIFSRFCIGK